jgi:hypothetical protein
VTQEGDDHDALPALVSTEKDTAVIIDLIMKIGNYNRFSYTRQNDTETSSPSRESQGDVVYIGCPIAPSYMSPNAGEGEGFTGSQPVRTAVHMEPK